MRSYTTKAGPSAGRATSAPTVGAGAWWGSEGRRCAGVAGASAVGWWRFSVGTLVEFSDLVCSTKRERKAMARGMFVHTCRSLGVKSHVSIFF